MNPQVDEVCDQVRDEVEGSWEASIRRGACSATMNLQVDEVCDEVRD